MINLHCHSLLSDGGLLPSEVAMRYLVRGYKVLAITDHTDYSNIDTIVPGIVSFCERWPGDFPIQVLPGVELTHVPPEQFAPLTAYAREKGVRIVVAHGETVTEPVREGTNRAALKAGVDILAHPGRITDDDVELARERGVFLEITSRRGHCATNQHVAAKAREHGARLILNNDSHTPEDIISPDELRAVGLDAGLTNPVIDEIWTGVRAYLSEKNMLDNQ
ncbi:MAG: histidinol phosphate phosphatase domain-containing protein [Candidatus Omnitrophica bacterium]|nr:histidinol phosphate phosphatase domain-containing protein [Candidatus Omnitrophota bacterium]